MTRRRCCCCDDEPITVPVATHRDLTTGDPHPTDNMLDGIELLWQCFDGDITGLTQETVAQNCTVETAEIVGDSTGGVRTGTPGHLQARLHGIVPSMKNFAAMKIVWTGQRFDAFAHKAHIAAGSLRLYGGEALASPLVDGLDQHAEAGPRLYAGIVIRSGGLLFVWGIAPFGETGVNGPVPGGDRDRCYDDLYPIPNFGVEVLEGGLLRQATLAELRDNGLTVDPVATQVDHEVGFCVFFSVRDAGYAGDLLDEYTLTWNFDRLTIAAVYGLACTVAFVDKPSLLLSSPSHSGFSNVEPLEFRGVSTTLTLTESAKFSATTLEEYELRQFDQAGYAYTGQFTAGAVTVDVWYLPCQVMVLRLDDGTHCALYVPIEHENEFTRYSLDGDDGQGDRSLGNATAPAFSGAALRDIWFPAGTVDNQRLSVPWYGSDCHDADSQPPSGLVVDGFRGKCVGDHPTEPPSVSVVGDLPNQLEWMTHNYSLDPIMIGMRRRISDNYSAFGGFTACDEMDFSEPVSGDCETGFSRALPQACNIHHMAALGLSTTGGIELIGPGQPFALHLYLDISEP